MNISGYNVFRAEQERTCGPGPFYGNNTWPVSMLKTKDTIGPHEKSSSLCIYQWRLQIINGFVIQSLVTRFFYGVSNCP